MSTAPPWFKLPEYSPLTPGSAASATPVVIVGCGLAGCHTAFELATRGIKVILLDASDTIAGGASGNAAGIVKPFVTRSPGHADKFYRAAFNFLLERFDSDKRLSDAAQFNECGVLQLFERQYPPNNTYTTCSASEASVLAGVQINSPAVFFRRAGWLNPSTLCQALVQHQNIEVRLQHRVSAITKISDVWSIAIEQGSEQDKERKAGKHTDVNTMSCIECSTIILANGANTNQFSPTRELPIIAARGQTSRFSLTENAVLKTVVTGKRYAIPDGSSVIVGASFVRDQTTTLLTHSEHEQNRSGLNTLLPSLGIDTIAHSGFCAIRATTPDRFPVVGPMPKIPNYPIDYARLRDGLPEHRFPNASYYKGLYVIGGFGSRGIVSTPYCAKLLADYLLGSTDYYKTSSEKDTENLSGWSAQLHPGRFKVRELRKARNLI